MSFFVLLSTFRNFALESKKADKEKQQENATY